MSAIPASRIVMNVAYWLRFLRTSRTRSLPAWPRSNRLIRASRLRRASRNSAVNRRNAEGRDRAEQVEPARAADEVRALRLRSGEVHREVEQEDEADDVVVDRAAGRVPASETGRSSRTMIANEKIVRTRMKML